ncbi:MAG: glycosyltransferase [Clostridia bacterium]|nr:glycosyltransferase [Clostridia bacterium]MBR5426854.1 glycosyltransferase [Clostridia bacterium]
MSEKRSLSVVITAYDETDSLRRVFDKLDAVGGADEFLFVLARRCSLDCARTVKEICDEKPYCRRIVQTGYGFGNAVREAIDSVRGTHMLYWTADSGAADPEIFPELLRLYNRYPDKIITTSRWLDGEGYRGYTPARKLINYVSQKTFRLMFRSQLTDFTNIIQIAPVDIYRRIRWEQTDFSFNAEMMFKLVKAGCEFIEVPSRNVERTEGKSHTTLRELVRYYPVIWKIFLSAKDDVIAPPDERTAIKE